MFDCLKRNNNIHRAIRNAEIRRFTLCELATFVCSPSVLDGWSVNIEPETGVFASYLCEIVRPCACSAGDIQHLHTLHKRARKNVPCLVLAKQSFPRFARHHTLACERKT